MFAGAKALPGVVLAGVLAVVPVHAQDSGADWPVFRGNSLQSGVAASALPNSLTVRWKFKAAEPVQGSPIIYDHMVFVGGLDGKLYALDLATGKKKWEYQAVTIKVAPAARDGRVYIGDADGTFHCVDAATGKKRWSVAARGQIVSPANFAQDKILFGSDDQHLYCVGPEGKVLWKCKTNEKLQAGAAVTGAHALIGGCDKVLHVIDLDDGREVKTLPLDGHIGASVAVWGDQAYVGTMANRFVAVNWKKGDIIWDFESKRGPQPFFSSAAVTEDVVVVGSRDKRVRAWQRRDGKELWTFPTKGRVDSSPVIVGQRVLVGSLDGQLYVLDLSRGTELSRFDLGGAIPGSPAVGGQCVVVATFPGEIFCLSAEK